MKDNNVDGRYNELINELIGENYRNKFKDAILKSIINNNSSGTWDELT